MSWSASFVIVDDEITEENKSNVSSEEAKAQHRIAEAAAYVVYASGAVGLDGNYRVTISGHANSNHEPTPGWSNDYVMVNISQLTEQEVERYR